MYHRRSAAVAAARTHSERRLTAVLAYVARRLRFGVSELPPGDRQFLGDVSREEGRYPMKGLERMIAIAARAERDADAEALPEAIRGQVLQRRAPTGDAIALFDEETAAQARADVAQFRFVRDRTPAAAQEALEAMAEHHAKVRRAMDALHLELTR